MTTPATSQQPPRQAQPQQPDSHLIALILAALAAYVTADSLTRALRAPFKAAGVGGPATRLAASLALSWPPDPMEGTGPAQRWAIKANTLRRAQFVLASARRIQAAGDAARSHDQPVMPALRDAYGTEQRFMAQHVQASTQRVRAASSVDGAAATHGNLLGWQAVKDSRCTPGCLKASGSNFRADRPPIVEGHPAYPGMVHGASCRCIARAPFPGAPLLPSS